MLIGSRSHHRIQLAVPGAAVVVALAVRPEVFVGLFVLAVVFVPLERALPLVRQRVLRPGLLADTTHLLVSGLLVAVATIVLVVAVALLLLPVRALDIESSAPGWMSAGVALVVVFVGSYWGHRLSHRVPFLWRFHAVHHSIDQMDWLAAGRLHPLDAAFTQACAAVPLVVLGYDRGPLAAATALVTVLAILQHANVRVRVPLLRWIVPTPEWHHWHHATDVDAHDRNFGLPLVDLVFGTAFLPKDRRPAGFGIPDPVPSDDYLGQLAYPFGR